MGADWDGREAPAPGQAIEDDRFYYRSDGEDIDDIVLKGGFVCRVFLGLRRFGKTSFLKRIERFCNGVNEGYEPDKAKYPNVRAYVVPMMTSSVVASSIKRALDDASETVKTKIVLLDDIQGFSTVYRNQDEDLPEIEEALKRLFVAAQKSGGKLRIVLAEPTNHTEWLQPVAKPRKQGAQKSPAGPQLLRICGESILNCVQMSALTLDQSAALLTGSPRDAKGYSGQRFDLARDQVGALHTAFGGNPWFLAHAHHLLAQRGDLSVLDSRRMAEFIDTVNKSVPDAGLDSIYGSLSDEEKFVVDLLHDRWRTVTDPERKAQAQQEERESLALCDFRAASLWHERARAVIFPRLKELGLIHVDGDVATRLTSDVFQERVDSIRDRKPILDDPDKIDQEAWQSLIGGRSPWERRTSRCVVHQFSDLLFEDAESGHTYWRRYIDWVEKLAAEKSDSWPHFIVVCGNLLPGAVSSQSEGVEEGYRERLRAAFERLMEVARHLRPVKGARPTEEQIILVPGVLDIDWPADASKLTGDKAGKLRRFYEKQKLWNEVVEGYRFSVVRNEQFEDEATGARYQLPTPLQFPQQRVVFLPFDTVALAGVEDDLGQHAMDDMTDVRARIRTAFAREWAILRDREDQKKKGKAQKLSLQRWQRFLYSTWRYAVCVDEDPEAQFLSSPFRWVEAEIGGTKNEPKTINHQWISDAGFVSDDARAHFSKLLPKDEDGPLLKIAVLHHSPRQMRRSSTVEFSQSYRFRRALASAGVQWVLHGHSLRQQRLNEAVVVTQKQGSTTLNLLSPGTFSTLPDYIPEDLAAQQLDDVPRRPSFNEIDITPPDRLDPDRQDFAVQVRFWEWRRDSAEPTESR